MIKSKSFKDNFYSFLLIEIVGMAVLAFVASAAVVFIVLMRNSEEFFVLLMENPIIYSAICLIPTLLMVVFVLIKQRRVWVVGFEFQEKSLELVVRSNSSKSIKTLSFSYSEVEAKQIKERGFVFLAKRKGIKILADGEEFDFVTNNFLWEDNHRIKRLFKEEVVARKLNTSTTSSLILD